MPRCDVIVLGGGAAGLTAALQLKRERPETSIVVAEKRAHPVPETAFKVGESGAEIGSHYLRETVGEEHMTEQQIRKFSLRIFSPRDGNADITRRPETGLGRVSPMRTYQFDRGRLENALSTAVTGEGIEFLDGYSVSGFEIGADRHRVTLRQNGDVREVDARWIVDASGRTGLLRRQLRLGVEISHDVNASWFRVAKRIAVDDWSDDPAWQARVPTRNRWQSTVQLVGEGYWVWIIPLPSNATSVGVVADPRFVPYERIRRYDALLDWLREHEPQLAAVLPHDESGLEDFRKLKKYAYGTRRGLSPQRWALTGEAGLFLDPLYSTGLDFIAVANTLATRLICEELAGAPDLRRRLKAYNAYYLGQFMGWEPAFQGQYEVFRDAQATAAKIVWDNASYFMFPVLMFVQGCITDPGFLASVREPLARMHHLNVWMQERLREVSTLDVAAAGYPVGTDAGVQDLFENVLLSLTKDEVRERIERNASRLEALARELTTGLYAPAASEPPPPPFELATDWEGELIEWVPYEQRERPPAEQAPQPADGWMIR